MIGVEDSTLATLRASARERPWIRRFFLLCASGALLAGTLALAVTNTSIDNVPVWLQATIIPAIILGLMAVNRDDRPFLLALTVLLLWVESLLTAVLYTIGIAFAMLIPLIGVGLAQPHLRGRGVVALFVATVGVSTAAVGIFALGVPSNPIGDPVFAVVAFGFLAAFALGLVGRVGARLRAAVDAADREIAARVVAERELGETTDLLQGFVASTPVAVLMLDENAAVSLWSPAAARLFAIDAAGALGKPFPVPLFLDEAGAPYDGLARGLAGDTIVGERAHLRRSDGAALVVEVHAAPRSGSPERRGLVVQVIDVTERVRLEDWLRKAHRMEAIGHVAAVVAHDVNNAMTAVSGYADLLGGRTEDPDTAGYAQRISTAADRVSRMSRDLLAYAGLGAGRPQSVDVVELVTRLAPGLRSLLGPDVSLEVRHHVGSGMVRIDPELLGEAIRNLVLDEGEALEPHGMVVISAGRREALVNTPPMIRLTVEGSGAYRATAPATQHDPSDEAVHARTSLDETAPPSAAGPASIVGGAWTVAPGPFGTAGQELFEPYLATGGSRTGLELAMVQGIVTTAGGEVTARRTAEGCRLVELLIPELAPAG